MADRSSYWGKKLSLFIPGSQDGELGGTSTYPTSANHANPPFFPLASPGTVLNSIAGPDSNDMQEQGAGFEDYPSWEMDGTFGPTSGSGSVFQQIRSEDYVQQQQQQMRQAKEESSAAQEQTQQCGATGPASSAPSASASKRSFLNRLSKFSDSGKRMMSRDQEQQGLDVLSSKRVNSNPGPVGGDASFASTDSLVFDLSGVEIRSPAVQGRSEALRPKQTRPDATAASRQSLPDDSFSVVSPVNAREATERRRYRTMVRAAQRQKMGLSPRRASEEKQQRRASNTRNKPLSNEDIDRENFKLLRNREAAMRSRQQKKERLRELEDENEALRARVEELESEVAVLRRRLEER